MTPVASALLALCLLGQSPPPAVGGERHRATAATGGSHRRAPRTRAPAIKFRPSKDVARRLFARGQALYAKRKYRRAITALDEALRHWDRREIHFNIALCYHELRDAVGAIRHLRAFTRDASLRERKAVPRALRRLRRKVGVLVIRANDAKAEILIDGELRGRGKVDWVVRPGDVEVVIRRTGESNLIRTLKARAGGTTYWDVTVDSIRVVGPGSPPKKVRLHYRWFTIAASVAVAAAATAVGLGLKTRSVHQDWDAAPSWELRDLGRRYQALTNVMWGLAGAAAISAGVLAYFTRWKKKERASEQTVTPLITPTGVAVTGRF